MDGAHAYGMGGAYQPSSGYPSGSEADGQRRGSGTGSDKGKDGEAKARSSINSRRRRDEGEAVKAKVSTANKRKYLDEINERLQKLGNDKQRQRTERVRFNALEKKIDDIDFPSATDQDMKAILDLIVEMEEAGGDDIKPIEKMVAKVRIKIARHGNRQSGS